MTDRALYVAMTGASAMLRGQATVAQNLANVDSTGFQATLDATVAVPVAGPGLPTRVAEVSNRDFPVDDLLAAMGRDKKVEAARIRFVLARRIGEAFTSADVPPETVRTVLTEDV